MIAVNRKISYLSAAFDSLEQTEEDNEPGGEKRQHELPNKRSRVLQSLGLLQYVIAGVVCSGFTYYFVMFGKQQDSGTATKMVRTRSSPAKAERAFCTRDASGRPTSRSAFARARHCSCSTGRCGRGTRPPGRSAQ